MRWQVRTECWALTQPFVIARETMDTLPLAHLTIEHDGIVGAAEAAGVDYRGETPETMAAEIEAFLVGRSIPCSRRDLIALLPAGGARNAIDCALWDLESRVAGRSVFDTLGLTPRPLATAMTLGIGTPDAMARGAARVPAGQPLKLKLGAGDGADLDRVAAVRAAVPRATVLVDANEGWDVDELVALLPELHRLDVAMIEQPLPRADDAALAGINSPIPLCADESFDDLSDLDRCGERYDAVNIKLDKCGGLTAALDIVAAARARGLRLMVGSMLGTSLGMAPAFVVGQYCDHVDLDGPLLLMDDRASRMIYAGATVAWPQGDFWGAGRDG